MMKIGARMKGQEQLIRTRIKRVQIQLIRISLFHSPTPLSQQRDQMKRKSRSTRYEIALSTTRALPTISLLRKIAS